MQFPPKEHRTTAQIYAAIANYCRIMDDNGYWGQAEYKFDYFRIVYLAFGNGLCGNRARNKYSTAVKRKRSLKPSDYAVCGEFIADHVQREWLNGRQPSPNQEGMLRDLTLWWDEWAYAWDKNPIPQFQFPRNRQDNPPPT